MHSQIPELGNEACNHRFIIPEFLSIKQFGYPWSFLFTGFYLCGKEFAKQVNEAKEIGGEMFIELKRANYLAAPGQYPITVKYGLSRVLLIGT